MVGGGGGVEATIDAGGGTYASMRRNGSMRCLGWSAQRSSSMPRNHFLATLLVASTNSPSSVVTGGKGGGEERREPW